MKSNSDFSFSAEDLHKLYDAAGVEPDAIMSENAIPSFQDTKLVIENMSQTILENGPDAFCELIAANRPYLMQCASINPEVVTVLLLCYRMGISKQSGACATALGALYYMGELVEQDYHKAAKLYQQAADWGEVQGLVNLGYIYEYGHIGKPDHQKAYECYSLAAALSDLPEALYKMGDMYARGTVFPADEDKAMQLWEKSLEAARNVEEVSQPAFRIATHILDSDPQRALFLFQQAEIGMRVDIDNGMVYYRNRLKQAIEGQDKARLLLEADGTLRGPLDF